jgi:hypothetical protein
VKRFTDTDIWQKEWFMSLSPTDKAAWHYLTAACDNVGVWAVNRALANFQIGAEVDWDSLVEKCNGNIRILDEGKWWLVDFCTFQHADLDESSKSNAVQSYVKLLKKHGLFQEYMNTTGTLHEGTKEQEREQVRERVKEEERARASQNGAKPYSPEFEGAWSQYPNKTNKKGALKAYTARRREGVEHAELELAVAGYARSIRAAGTEAEFIMHGATFFGPNERWKEYVNFKPPPVRAGPASVVGWTCAKCGKEQNHTGSYCLGCGGDR